MTETTMVYRKQTFKFEVEINGVAWSLALSEMMSKLKNIVEERFDEIALGTKVSVLSVEVEKENG